MVTQLVEQLTTDPNVRNLNPVGVQRCDKVKIKTLSFKG